MSVVEQEIEAKLRDWKVQWDEYATRLHEAHKMKKDADNTGSNIAALMKRADLTSHKTYYGTVKMTKDKLSVTGHAASFDLKPKKTAKKVEKSAGADV